MVWRGRCRDGGGAVREAAVRGNGGAEQGGVGGGGSVHGQDGGVWRWRRSRHQRLFVGNVGKTEGNRSK